MKENLIEGNPPKEKKVPWKRASPIVRYNTSRVEAIKCASRIFSVRSRPVMNTGAHQGPRFPML